MLNEGPVFTGIQPRQDGSDNLFCGCKTLTAAGGVMFKEPVNSFVEAARTSRVIREELHTTPKDIIAAEWCVSVVEIHKNSAEDTFCVAIPIPNQGPHLKFKQLKLEDLARCNSSGFDKEHLREVTLKCIPHWRRWDCYLYYKSSN